MLQSHSVVYRIWISLFFLSGYRFSMAFVTGRLPAMRAERWFVTTSAGASRDIHDDEDVSQERKYVPPDFKVLDDDDDEGKNELGDRAFKPPDYTILQDDTVADDGKGSTYSAPDKDSGIESDYPSSVDPYEEVTSNRPAVSTYSASDKDSGIESDDSSLVDPYKEVTSNRPAVSRRRKVVRAGQSVQGGASWMQRNSAFASGANDQDEELDSPDINKRRQDDKKSNRTNRTFRQDFRGTRVFVQNLPTFATWQNVKDHFRIAGDVVFASVSADPVTGESKRCGVVQYETTEMALTAIAIMRNHPLDGYQLYVREDVQEKDSGELGNKIPRKKKGPTPPSKWKCANEENAHFLSEDERRAILSLIRARDDARRRRQYDASDNMRDQLKYEYNVHLDDRLNMWWTAFEGNQVPETIHAIKGQGRWGDLKPWRQIPTTPDNDACVNPDLVNGLLEQRDIARREKDFATADALLEEARTSPDGDLNLRIHDESRTWRIWTAAPPPRPVVHQKSPAEQCLEIVEEYAPEKLQEIELILKKFPGREYKILKNLKQRYKR